MQKGDRDEKNIFDLFVCTVCGGCICHTCKCAGGPRGPKLHTGLNDEPHGDNLQSD